VAARVVGADYSPVLLARGRQHFAGRVPLVRLTAESLPFRDASFDLVLFLEASYYVPGMESAFREIARVLAADGQALIVNANPERPDFIKSPYSVHYHTADEFRAALESLGMSVRIQGAFPVNGTAQGTGARLVGLAFSVVRRLLETLGLVPKTLLGRARLKRLVFGRLPELPAELPEGYASVAARQSVGSGPIRGFKVICVTAQNSRHTDRTVANSEIKA
jgi:SAM-dependent methyltransferase